MTTQSSTTLARQPATETTQGEAAAPIQERQYDGDYRSFVMKFGKANDPIAGVRLFDVPGETPWTGIMFGDGTKESKPPQSAIDFLKTEPKFSFRHDLGMWRREIDPERPAQSRLENQEKYEAVCKMLREAKGAAPAAARAV